MLNYRRVLWIESKPTSFHQVQILHGILAKNFHIDQLPKLSGFRVRGYQLRVHVGYRYALLCQKLSKLLENHPKIIKKSSKNHPNPENDQNFGHLQTFSDWTQETARISDCGKMDAQKACCSSKMPTWKRPQKIARFLLELHKETPSCLLREIPSVWQLRPNVWDLKHHVSWLNTHLWWSNHPSRKSC